MDAELPADSLAAVLLATPLVFMDYVGVILITIAMFSAEPSRKAV